MTEAIGYQIQGGLQRLKDVIKNLQSVHAPKPALPQLPRLKAAIDGLDVGPAPRPPDGMERYTRHWNNYLEARIDSLDMRTIRNLCWSPDIATDSRFQDYIDRNRIDLGSRALIGMIYSCHAVWNAKLGKSGVLRKIRQWLEHYKGPNRLLVKWKQAERMIIGDNAPQEAGNELLKGAPDVAVFCKNWGIDENSAFTQIAVAHAAQFCRKEMDRIPELRQCLLIKLLAWQQWEPGRFKEEASETILSPVADCQEMREALRKFVAEDRRLGDPRLTQNQANWAGIRKAEAKVIEWFSQFDIVFFFDHVLQERNDPHRRKEFWLDYVRKVRRSRPLLNLADRTRLNHNVKNNERLESKHFGKMGDQETTSSFVLDFGKIVVIEFSAVGNACYAYTEQDFNKIMPDFWTPRPFKSSDLKKKNGSVTKQLSALWDGVHRPEWQHKAAQLLAFYGIRP